jgi:hypothetical protein
MQKVAAGVEALFCDSTAVTFFSTYSIVAPPIRSVFVATVALTHMMVLEASHQESLDAKQWLLEWKHYYLICDLFTFVSIFNAYSIDVPPIRPISAFAFVKRFPLLLPIPFAKRHLI